MANNAYQLIFASLLSRRFEYIISAVYLKPIQQEEWFFELLKKPTNTNEQLIQDALNSYARNSLIETSGKTVYNGIKPSVVIHFGSTKTGSTYIQHYLEKNRAELLRNGIWYPEVGLFWQLERPHKQAGHVRFTSEANSKNKEKKLRRHINAGLTLAGGKIHTIILSSEAYFLNRKSVNIPDLFPGSDIKLIGYLRRQDDWANSQYAEFVAGGAVGKVDVDIDSWLELRTTQERLNYFSYLELWASKIGRENIIAKIYDRGRFLKGDIVYDFCNAIGIGEYANLPRPVSKQYNDFPFNAAHVKGVRYFNSLPWSTSSNYLSFIERVSQAIDAHNNKNGYKPQKVDLLSKEKKSEILSTCRDDNLKLDQIYFECESGFTGLTVPKGQVKPDRQLDVAEWEILFENYFEFNPGVGGKYKEAPAKSSNKSRAKNKASEISVRFNDHIGLCNQMNLSDGQIISTKTYRIYCYCSSFFLSDRKKRKLSNRPVDYFSDIKGVEGKVIRKCIAWELCL
ncbi:hypothetical protein R5R73_11435 [Salinicola sp. LHM]|uniref:hypothetical protein n=1 Tax=Salinicola sp. LHM TaxID=3065298 RepID=UPI002ACE10A7|nr:hypothetical protein [Salinicola sp. LHM]WQH31681.1 hypothetical protein R5R73_11435 [Salinicola sp. LHM]